MRQTYSIGGTVTRILRDTELRFVTPVLIWQCCTERLSVSNFSCPVEYHFSQVNNNCSHLLVRPVSNVVLLPCRTQFINYRYIKIHFKSSLNRFLLFSSFVFCNSQFYRPSYIRRLRPSCATVVSATQNSSRRTFETGLRISNV